MVWRLVIVLLFIYSRATGNAIGSGNDGIKIGRRNDGSSESLGQMISDVFGSPFGNGDSQFCFILPLSGILNANA
jgi:hypothetical protein